MGRNNTQNNKKHKTHELQSEIYKTRKKFFSNRSLSDETTKRAITKDFFFSKRRKETGSESIIKSKYNNSYDRPWKYSLLLT
jgi:hypothetical protein